MPFGQRPERARRHCRFYGPANLTVAHDAKNWGMYSPRNFEAATRNSDQTLTKRGRMEDLARSKMAGTLPCRWWKCACLISGTAAILISPSISRTRPARALTRIWINAAGIGWKPRATRRASRIRQPLAGCPSNPRGAMHPIFGQRQANSLRKTDANFGHGPGARC